MSAPGRSDPRPARPASRASEIAPGVYVGGVSDAPMFRGTRICVRDEPPTPPGLADAHLPVYDPATDRPIVSHLEKVVELTDAARRTGTPVLLYCGHGVRRGALAGAWYLHRQERISLEAAYARVRAVRPQIEAAVEWIGDVTPLEDRS